MTAIERALAELRSLDEIPEGCEVCPYCFGGCLEVHETKGLRWCRICRGMGSLPAKQARQWETRLEWLRRQA